MPDPTDVDVEPAERFMAAMAELGSRRKSMPRVEYDAARIMVALGTFPDGLSRGALVFFSVVDGRRFAEAIALLEARGLVRAEMGTIWRSGRGNGTMFRVGEPRTIYRATGGG